MDIIYAIATTSILVCPIILEIIPYLLRRTIIQPTHSEPIAIPSPGNS